MAGAAQTQKTVHGRPDFGQSCTAFVPFRRFPASGSFLVRNAVWKSNRRNG